MVTGVSGPAMTANVIGASVPYPVKDTPAKSDRRVSIYFPLFIECVKQNTHKYHNAISLKPVTKHPLVLSEFGRHETKKQKKN